DQPSAGLVLGGLRAQGTHHHAGRHRLRRRRTGVHHRAQVPRLGGRVVIKRRHWAQAAAPLVLVLLAATGCTSTADAPAKPTGGPAASEASATTVAQVCATPGAGPSQ